ncbi:MAG: hypothetical protein JWM82_1784 [Myxococcales bacterium]|jgi:hypothetical protein|nr:hypothetical protein [Myxococcales bacterium]
MTRLPGPRPRVSFALAVALLASAASCVGLEASLRAARLRAAADTKCPYEATSASGHSEQGADIVDVDACGRQLKYSCVMNRPPRQAQVTTCTEWSR